MLAFGLSLTKIPAVTLQMSSEASQRREPLTFHFGSSNLTDQDIATKSWRHVGKPFCFERDVIQPRESAQPLQPHALTLSSPQQQQQQQHKGKHKTQELSQQEGGKKLKVTPDSQ
jgi:hypothetical protein